MIVSVFKAGVNPFFDYTEHVRTKKTCHVGIGKTDALGMGRKQGELASLGFTRRKWISMPDLKGLAK